ncbi:hypothetical protein AAMO2058_001312700 [Amorphochlora amoebiformis]
MASRGTSTFNQVTKLAKKIHHKNYPREKDQPLKLPPPKPESKEEPSKHDDVKAADEEEIGAPARYISTRVRREWVPDGGPMDSIRELHKTIQETIMEMQGRTIQVLKNQEQDLLRAFKTRMAGVQQELTKERKKNESGSVEWVEKCHKLTSELEWLRDTAQKLSLENKNATRELRRVKRQLKEMELDREYLLKQLVAMKKENSHLVTNASRSSTIGVPPAIARLERTYASATSQGLSRKGRKSFNTMPAIARRDFDFEEGSPGRKTASPMGSSMGTPLTNQQEKRYRSVISKLKRQLEVKQTKLDKIKVMYQKEVSSKNELQTVLKQGILDIRQNMEARGKEGETKQKSAAEEQKSRRKVIESLLSNDKVVYVLYERMFPSNNIQNKAMDQLLKDMDGDAGNGEDVDGGPWSGWIDSKLGPTGRPFTTSSHPKSRPNSSQRPKSSKSPTRMST